MYKLTVTEGEQWKNGFIWTTRRRQRQRRKWWRRCCLFSREAYGNPSSVYGFGAANKEEIARQREKIAAVLGAKEQEIYFTAGGTESDNWALKAAAEAYGTKGKHIITSKIEHHAILHTCEYLEKQRGFEVTYLDVDENGIVDVEAVKAESARIPFCFYYVRQQ